MITKLNTLENIFEESNYLSQFRDVMYGVVNKVYDELIHDDDFMLHIKCELNTKEDIFPVYKGWVENIIIINFADFSTDANIERYNIMCDDRKFYDDWTAELFDLIFEQYH